MKADLFFSFKKKVMLALTEGECFNESSSVRVPVFLQCTV